MRTVYVVTAQPTQATIDAVRPHNPEMAELMKAPIVQRYFTKKAADKLEAEWRATGMYTVSRSTAMAGTLEDVLMHVTGLCPAC